MEFLFVLIPLVIIICGIRFLTIKHKQRKDSEQQAAMMYQQAYAQGFAPVPQPKRRSDWGGAVVGAIVLIVIAVFILRPIINSYNKKKEEAEAISRADTYTEEEYKSMCKSVTYEEIARDQNALKGSYVTFTGVIAQELEENLYRMTVDNELNSIVFRFSSDTRLLTGDKVTIWGESSGFIEGETTLGVKTKAPKINAVYIFLVQK